MKLFCDKDYPDRPPSVKFHSRINMTCVNQENGMVSMALHWTCLHSFAAENRVSREHDSHYRLLATAENRVIGQHDTAQRHCSHSSLLKTGVSGVHDSAPGDCLHPLLLEN